MDLILWLIYIYLESQLTKYLMENLQMAKNKLKWQTMTNSMRRNYQN